MKKLLPLGLALLLLLSGCAGTPAGSAINHADDGRVVIALLDTGVSTAAIQSEHLLPGWNYVTGSADTEDRINHGTAVASAILGCESAGVEGTAPTAYLVPLVVTDKGESTQSITPETLAQVIRDSVDKYGADIINLSLGIKKDSPEVKDAMEYAERNNVLVVSAVGNEGDSTDLYYPAAYETVLAVGSHDEDMELSDFSQRNGTVDILAPGEDIWLASKTGRTYGARGTSYATGFVSAAAARFLESSPTLTPAELREQLYSAAIDIGAPGYDQGSGWGILSMDTALDV